LFALEPVDFAQIMNSAMVNQPFKRFVMTILREKKEKEKSREHDSSMTNRELETTTLAARCVGVFP
jgi:hypothetical protein